MKASPLEGPRRRRRAPLARAALVLGGLVLALCLAEGALALWTRAKEARRDLEPAPFYRWTLLTNYGEPVSMMRGPLKLVLDPVLSYRNLPDQTGPWFSINSRGYRGGELRERRAGVPRIVVLGGSTAFSTGVGSDADTFAAALEAEIGGAEVVNAAVIGYNSGQELALLLTEILDLDPQIVIAFDGLNDARLGRLLPDGRLACDVFAQIEEEAGENTRARRSAPAALRLAASHLFAHTRELAGSALGARPSSPYARKSPEEEFKLRLRWYCGNIVRMSSACKSRGSRFLVLVQPERARSPDYRSFVSLAMQTMRDAGIEVLAAGAVEGLEREEFLDEVHLTARGNRILAHALAAYIAAHPNPS